MLELCGHLCSSVGTGEYHHIHRRVYGHYLLALIIAHSPNISSVWAFDVDTNLSYGPLVVLLRWLAVDR